MVLSLCCVALCYVVLYVSMCVVVLCIVRLCVLCCLSYREQYYSCKSRYCSRLLQECVETKRPIGPGLRRLCRCRVGGAEAARHLQWRARPFGTWGNISHSGRWGGDKIECWKEIFIKPTHRYLIFRIHHPILRALYIASKPQHNTYDYLPQYILVPPLQSMQASSPQLQSTTIIYLGGVRTARWGGFNVAVQAFVKSAYFRW